MIKAIVFDFDGLILDTEGPEFQSWQEIYQAHGCALTLEKWAECIGTADAFDPYDLLEERLDRPIDRAAIRARHRARQAELMAGQAVLPGVERTIHEAQAMGLKLGIASSSTREWVTGYLDRFGLRGHFSSLKCADDVALTKPDPALYVLSVQALGVAAHEAVALEDSPNGVLAAKRAGLFCVAVPNALTRQLTFDGADVQLNSLADLPLEALLARLQG